TWGPAWALGCLIALVFVGSSAAALETLPTLEVSDDTLERVDPDSGDTVWEIVHASVWDQKDHKTAKRSILNPVRLGSRWFYASGAWLFELDVQAGVILSRTLFPGEIAELRAEEGALALAVEVIAESAESSAASEAPFVILVPMRHVPGGPQPREMWSLGDYMAVWKDATYLADPIASVGLETDEGQHREAIDQLL